MFQAKFWRHGGPQLYNAFHEMPPQVIHAQTNNPLGLFLSTLLPWNPVPNAPALETQEASAWYAHLLDFLRGFRTTYGDEIAEG